MKKIILSILFLSSFLFAVDTSDFKFLLKNEPKIKNVYYDTSFKKLVILVKDDGTNRNGFAEYVSLELKSKSFTEKDVAVIYIKDTKTPMSLIKQGYGKALGKARMIR